MDSKGRERQNYAVGKMVSLSILKELSKNKVIKGCLQWVEENIVFVIQEFAKSGIFQETLKDIKIDPNIHKQNAFTSENTSFHSKGNDTTPTPFSGTDEDIFAFNREQ